ncbi:hypothetical protein [Methanolobus bombayensis]|nr:hypothetical protein [Methanolobus bombayensis]MBP1909170.1 hypothetical protein [Methanolobus bombayensis]
MKDSYISTEMLAITILNGVGGARMQTKLSCLQSKSISRDKDSL